jgi:DNA-directed RNA polymerase specialized sigma subunit
LEDTEKNLRDELENAQTALDTSRSRGSDEAVGNSKTSVETGDDMESSKKAILDKLEERKRELVRCSFF